MQRVRIKLKVLTNSFFYEGALLHCMCAYFATEQIEEKNENLVKAFDVLIQRANDDDSNVLFTVANDLAKVGAMPLLNVCSRFGFSSIEEKCKFLSAVAKLELWHEIYHTVIFKHATSYYIKNIENVETCLSIQQVWWLSNLYKL